MTIYRPFMPWSQRILIARMILRGELSVKQQDGELDRDTTRDLELTLRRHILDPSPRASAHETRERYRQ